MWNFSRVFKLCLPLLALKIKKANFVGSFFFYFGFNFYIKTSLTFWVIFMRFILFFFMYVTIFQRFIHDCVSHMYYIDIPRYNFYECFHQNHKIQNNRMRKMKSIMNSFGFLLFLFFILRILISTLFQQHNQGRRKQGKSMSRNQRVLYAMIIMLCKI